METAVTGAVKEGDNYKVTIKSNKSGETKTVCSDFTRFAYFFYLNIFSKSYFYSLNVTSYSSVLEENHTLKVLDLRTLVLWLTREESSLLILTEEPPLQMFGLLVMLLQVLKSIKFLHLGKIFETDFYF